MTRNATIYKTCLAMIALLGVLFLLAPGTLADGGVSSGTDDVRIAEDGTVTLISGHMAGERVSSVQFQLAAEGEATFTFSEALSGWNTYCSRSDGVLEIYIAGSKPLMAEGQTELVVGTVSGVEAQGVTLVEHSLGYVYGKQIKTQVVSAEKNAPPVTTVKDELGKLLEDAKASYGDPHKGKYSEETWSVLEQAIADAEQLWLSGTASDEDMRAAMDAVNAAIEGLDPIDDEEDDENGGGQTTPEVDVNGGDPNEPGTGLGGESGGSTEPTPTSGQETTAPTATVPPSSQPSAPHTGDETALLPWAVMMSLCGLLLAALYIRRRATRG